MSRSNEQNEQEALKLDDHFKEMLARVKPYILRLTSVENAQMCKVWLDKLSVSTSQRRLRNQYLTELCRQLRNGTIGGIFSTCPPDGLLLPLPKSYHTICVSSSLSDLSDSPTRTYQGCLKPTKQIRPRGRTPVKYHGTKPGRTVRFCDEYIPEKDKLQTCRRHRPDPFSIFTEQLRTENEYLKDKLAECQRNANDTSCTLQENIRVLTAEVTALREELQELQKAKQSETYHRGVQVSRSKPELSDACSKNDDAVIATGKSRETMHGKAEEPEAAQNHWMDKLKTICQRYDTLVLEKSKEVQLKEDLLEKKDAERRHEIELLTNKIQDLEAKLETKISEEGKLQAMLIEQYTTMRKGFEKMRSEIDFATENQNQQLTSKVAALKRQVIKLEKLRGKLGQEYEKKILDVVKNKDLEIKSLQLQLQGQKNELCTSLSSEQQCEVDNLVSSLEEQYKLLLTKAKEAAEYQSRKYLKRIADLEDQVLYLSRTQGKSGPTIE